jgi:hypothetical protein
MDITYLIAATALWAAALGLAFGCERLQQRKVTP